MTNITRPAIVVAAAFATLTALGCAAESDSVAETPAETAQEVQSEEELRETRGYKMASHRLNKILDDINATDTQRKKAHEVKDQLAEDAFALKDSGKDTKLKALEEWKKDTPDSKALHAMVDQRVEEWRKLAHEAVDAAVELHGTLTPEQRAEIAKMVEEKMDRR